MSNARDAFYAAVIAFCDGPNDHEQRKNAERFLETFMASRDAWQVAHELLRADGAAIDHRNEVRWMAAKVLYSKVRFDYDELEAASRLPFRDALLEHLQRHAAGAYNVRVQLALAVASLAVQMVEWEDPTRELVQLLAETQPLVLVDILKVVPEECFDKRRQIPLARRQRICYEVAPYVLAMLASYLRQVNELEAQRRVFECSLAWLRHASEQLSEQHVFSTTLFADAFAAITNGELADICSQLICEVIALGYQHPAGFPTTIGQIARGVFGLWPMYESASNEDDSLVIEALLRVFLYLGSMALDQILERTDMGSNLLRLLTQCSSTPYDREGRVIDFWSEFCQCLQSRSEQERVSTVVLYSNEIKSMFESLFEKLRYPQDFDARIPFDQDDHRILRGNANILVNALASVYDPFECLQIISLRMEVVLGQFRERPDDQWQNLEAVLYMFRCIARNLDLEIGGCRGAPVIQRMLGVVLSLPRTHGKVVYTSALILGRYGDFINIHENGSLIEPALAYLFESMASPHIAPASCKALRNLMDGCSERLASADRLFGLIIAQCTPEKMTSLDLRDQLEFVEGVCAIVSAVRPIDRLASALQQFAQPFVQSLLKSSNTPPDMQTNHFDAIGDALDLVAHVFNFVQINSDQVAACEDPMIAFTRALWPFVQDIATRFQHSEKVIEKLFRLIKYAVRCTDKRFPMLNELFTLVLSMFERTQHSCTLYLVSVVVDQFGELEQYHVGFAQVLETMSVNTFQLLHSLDSVRERPDLADDYFNLLLRYIRRCPSIICTAAILELACECALRCLPIEHREASIAVINFFDAAIDLCFASRSSPGLSSGHREPFATILTACIPRLVETLLASLTHVANRAKLRAIVELFRTMLEVMPHVCRSTFPPASHVLPDPKSYPRSKFVNDLLEASTPTAQREIILDFEAAAAPTRRLEAR